MLNCLKRIDSEEELRRRMRTNEMQQQDDDNNNNNNNNMANFKLCLGQVERNMSDNFKNIKPPFQTMRTKSNHGLPTGLKQGASSPRHRVTNSGPPAYVLDPSSPKLVRSSGMRRDWSFEDLRRTVTN
jgi:hypothetical protein